MTDTSKPLTPKAFGSNEWREEIEAMHTKVDRDAWRQDIMQRLTEYLDGGE